MDQLIQQMKVILATNFALYLKSHNYHWNIEGLNFPQYHDFLNNFYTEVFAQTDLIAENIRYLDSYAPGSLERFLELADIQEAADVIPSAMDMIQNLKVDNNRYIVHLRAGIVAADQANEPAVSNFLQELLGAHQKKAWMLRSIIK
jgi:starvation-inducible DNA-binding protein